MSLSLTVTTGLFYCADSTHEHHRRGGLHHVCHFLCLVSEQQTDWSSALTATLVYHCLLVPCRCICFLRRDQDCFYIRQCDFFCFVFFLYLQNVALIMCIELTRCFPCGLKAQVSFLSDCTEEWKYIPKLLLLLQTLFVHDCLNMQL